MNFQVQFIAETIYKFPAVVSLYNHTTYDEMSTFYYSFK